MEYFILLQDKIFHMLQLLVVISRNMVIFE